MEAKVRELEIDGRVLVNLGDLLRSLGYRSLNSALSYWLSRLDGQAIEVPGKYILDRWYADREVLQRLKLGKPRSAPRKKFKASPEEEGEVWPPEFAGARKSRLAVYAERAAAAAAAESPQSLFLGNERDHED